jgi:hypothetical protein
MTNQTEKIPMYTNEKSIILSPFIQMVLPFNDESLKLKAAFDAPPIHHIEIDKVDSRIGDLPTLSSELSYHSFKYTRICRGVRSYVYQQTLGKETIGYEVFLIRIQHEAALYGKSYPARERWPKDGDFGKTAWSFWTLEEAMDKFNTLEK